MQADRAADRTPLPLGAGDADDAVVAVVPHVPSTSSSSSIPESVALAPVAPVGTVGSVAHYPLLSEDGSFSCSVTPAVRPLDSSMLGTCIRRYGARNLTTQFQADHSNISSSSNTFPKRVAYPAVCDDCCCKEEASRKHVYTEMVAWVEDLADHVGKARIIFEDVVIACECTSEYGRAAIHWAHLATACGAGSDFTANHKARINMIEFDVIGHTGEDDYTAVELRYKREAFIELLDPCNLLDVEAAAIIQNLQEELDAEEADNPDSDDHEDEQSDDASASEPGEDDHGKSKRT